MSQKYIGIPYTKERKENKILIEGKYKKQRIIEYNKNPKLCKNCNKIIPYGEHPKKKFCDLECSRLGRFVCR